MDDDRQKTYKAAWELQARATGELPNGSPVVSEGNRFPVVAAAYKLDENEGDIFDSPFA